MEAFWFKHLSYRHEWEALVSSEELISKFTALATSIKGGVWLSTFFAGWRSKLGHNVLLRASIPCIIKGGNNEILGKGLLGSLVDT